MAYDPQIAVIHSARAQLAALAGVPPRVTTVDGIARIEIDVTDALRRRWTRAIHVLSLGTEFGLTTNKAGQVAWLHIELREGAHYP